MSEQFHRKLNAYLAGARTTEGKVTIVTSIIACLVLVSFVTLFQVNVPVASADDVTTSVTVLNTPPTYDTDVSETVASATSTPTNSGGVITFQVQATDSSGDNYYLLICKTNGAPTALAGGPTCNGGISNQWAVSPSTVSGAVASASTTTIDTFPFNAESNHWYGFICDNNATLARCNATVNEGTSGQDNAAPFVINHVPVFHSISNNGPINPGSILTWTSGSYDNDTLSVADQVRLIVCSAPGITNGACTNAGGFASSTLAASNAATSSTFTAPYQDRWYPAYVYVVDTHNHAATSTFQGYADPFEIQNVAPTVDAATISILDYDDTVDEITLTVPSATSGVFKVKFTVIDDNGCLNASSTDEISSNIMAAYRSGVTQANCSSAEHYNSNSCYAATSTLFTPFYNCTQDAATCSGISDSDATFTCNFALWYNADPTDATTQYTAQSWLASVRSTDDDGLGSAFEEKTLGTTELASFLAFNITETAVAFGSLQPGDANNPMTATTTLFALGNIGLDQDIYGDTMCTNWTAPDSCDSGGINTATEIAIANQRVATTTYSAYSSGYILSGSTTPTEITVNVPKPTSTSTPVSRETYFGIEIPLSITLAGSYSGQDTITAKKSNPSNW